MDYGYFNDLTKEYTILDMFPKRPWLNFLWNEQLIATINQFGFGQSKCRDEHNRMRQLTKENDSRLLYIKNEETGEFYSANRNYEGLKFDDFQTVVGQGYSIIKSTYKGLSTSFKIFIPSEGLFECWEVELTNNSKQTKEISLVTYADPQVELTGHSAYSHGEFESNLNGVYLSHEGFNLSSPLTGVFFAANRKVDSYETTNRYFTGVYGDVRKPKALSQEGLSCKNTSFDNQMVAAMQFKMTLEPGTKEKVLIILGLSDSLENAVEIKEKVLNEFFFQSEQHKIKTISEEFSEKIQVNTPDSEINSLANVWLKRQMDLGKTWGRGYSKGFRDIMQDVTGFMPLDTEVARQKILYCLGYQFENGNTWRSWETFDNHPYRDGASWLIPSVTGYLKETGDYSILDEEVNYFNSDVKGTVLDHCDRGINFLLSELGEHGLCLWGGGDWNDSINNVGMQLKGESVWLSEATVKAANEYAELLEIIELKDRADVIRKKADAIKNSIIKDGWNKDHFIYGINDWSEKIGSYETMEGQIFLNPQTWAILSNVVEGKDAIKLLDFIEQELGCSFGYVQQKPSYSNGTDRIGRISYMEKGCYENGSVYNHGVTFKIAADCKMGRGNLAYKSIKKILASNLENPVSHSGVEPYAVTNMYLGPENELRSGESLIAWITGTAGWLFRCIVEYIIGIQAEYNGLRITPCLPSEWKEISARREYRNAIYNIRIINPSEKEKGIATITVDGRQIEGNILPDFADDQEHTVIVIIS